MSDANAFAPSPAEDLPTEDPPSLQDAVRARYGARAREILAAVDDGSPATTGCGSSPCGATACCDPVTADLYSAEQTAAVPAAALQASLGCGNPTALIDLRPGETVLDLGSGGGIDVILSARRVGPTGKAYGVDMTDEMLTLARRNAADAGVDNVEFLKGQIEDIPLPDASVDVVISNCVINLSGDKPRVLREAFRVLKPGGRFAVSDIVVEGPVPEDLRSQVELWVGCIAGALTRSDYEASLRAAGFVGVEIVPTRYYRAEDLSDPAVTAWLETLPPAERESLSRAFFSAFVRATKP